MKIEKIVELLKQKQLTISTCESATSGFLAATLGTIPGVSEVYKGSLITYCNEAKVVLAGVKYETIKKYGAISEQTVEEMAVNTAKILNTNICVSVSGNAGPSSTENKPVGLFCVGISIFNNPNSYTIQFEKTNDRKKMIELITNYVFEILTELLK